MVENKLLCLFLGNLSCHRQTIHESEVDKIKMRKIKFNDIKYFFRDIKHGIENLITWFPIIWKDRWWDHWFFFVVLHKKLDLMEKNFRSYGHHTKADKDADKMKICALLAKRIMDDNYFEMASKQHREKWGEPNMDWIDIDNSELVELKITYDGVITEKDKEQERKEFKTAIEQENYLREQDIKMLFNLIHKNIQTWWD